LLNISWIMVTPLAKLKTILKFYATTTKAVTWILSRNFIFAEKQPIINK